MSRNDASYYLKRIRFHRAMQCDAQCIEARLCHEKLLNAYRRRLAEIRKRRSPRVSRTPAVTQYC